MGAIVVVVVGAAVVVVVDEVVVVDDVVVALEACESPDAPVHAPRLAASSRAAAPTPSPFLRAGWSIDILVTVGEVRPPL
jgi:hypothetical protein